MTRPPGFRWPSAQRQTSRHPPFLLTSTWCSKGTWPGIYTATPHVQTSHMPCISVGVMVSADGGAPLLRLGQARGAVVGVVPRSSSVPQGHIPGGAECLPGRFPCSSVGHAPTPSDDKVLPLCGHVSRSACQRFHRHVGRCALAVSPYCHCHR